MADKPNLNVSQAQMPKEFITPTGKKEPLNVKQLLPRARLNVYQEMLKNNKPLTDEQKEDYENLKNQGDSVDALRNKEDLKKEKPADDDEKRKFFEEKDILEYLYQNWLLDGANWICDKTTKGIWWVTEASATWIWNTGKEAYKEGKEKGKEGKKLDNDMTRYAAALNKTSEDLRKRNCNVANAALAKFEERMGRFAHSFDTDPNTRVVLTEEEIHSSDYQHLLALGPQRAQQVCHHAADDKRRQITELQAINYIATALSRAQHMQHNMTLETPEQPLTNGQMAAEIKRNMYLIAGQLNASSTPDETLQEMIKQVNKANKIVNESMDNGSYKNNKNKKWFNSPKKNKPLNRLNKFLGIDENNQLTAQAMQALPTIIQSTRGHLVDNFDNSQTMPQALINAQMQQQAFATRQEENNNAAAALDNQENKRVQNKQHVAERIQKIVETAHQHGRFLGAVSPSYYNETARIITTGKPVYKVDFKQQQEGR